MNEIKTISQLVEALKKNIRKQNRADSTKPLLQDTPQIKKDERHFCISLAGHVFAIDSLYSEVYSLCGHYLSDQEPEIRIAISDDDIENEYRISERSRLSNSESYMETLAVYRKISEIILDYDSFLMHGAVIAVDNSAYLFTAESGTGKTTHIQKWLENLDRAYVVNGDKPIIKITEQEAIACGTPWCGKEHLETNAMVPLKAIVFMERGENNSIKEIQFGRAFNQLLQQTYRPEKPEKIKKTISLLSKLNGKIQFYQYTFNNMKDDAFKTSYEALTGNKA